MRVLLAINFCGIVTCSITAVGAPQMTVKLESSAFANNQPIPQKYTADGSDISPPLSWENVPAGTRELAIVCDDPDAPSKEPWVHWVIYKIPGDVRKLPEQVPLKSHLPNPAGALQGHNSFSSGPAVGYRGPAPPPGHGTHHYHFRIFALDAALAIPPDADKTALLRAMNGHVLGQGLLIGTYRR